MRIKRVLALLLALGLLWTSASALTAEQAGQLLQDYYIDEVPRRVLDQTTVEEMLAALGDRYTTYYTAEEYDAFLASMEDARVVGIGIQAYYREEGVLLVQVAPDSPAREGGLQVGDVIIAIGGHDARGAAEGDIDGWIHGEEGTQVTLTVQRGEGTFSVTLTRREVVFPTVTLDKIEDRVGWITCSAFGSTTFGHFYDIITAYDDRVDEWVIDLRGNGGGDVLAALFSAGCFGGTGSGVYLRSGEGIYYRYLFDPEMIAAFGYYDGDLSAFGADGCLTEDAAHVLVDEYTASAAELFCAAIRDSGAGLIVGARTYGKGVAQTLFNGDSSDVGDYFQEGDALKITTDRAFSRAGSTYDHVGILPHLAVDADLADEVIALLAAPLEEEDDLLIFGRLASGTQSVRAMAVPLRIWQDPERAAAVEALLNALPEGSYCALVQNGERVYLTGEEAALLAAAAAPETRFSDVEDYAYEEAVNALGRYGIVSGVGNGAFCPDRELTRAEACALLGKALRFPQNGTAQVFADVPADAWYAPYVSALYSMGLVGDCGDGLFHPERVMTQEEFLVLLSRTAQWLDMDFYEMADPEGLYGDLTPTQETLAERFGDYSAWARAQIWLCSDLSWADWSELDPKAAVTRGRAAAGLYNLLTISGVIPN